ncbi:MAG: 50S ribosomal protein L17, partial [Candidatus Magasanikbacteria bacterium]|nr:50S ribosomal protein L17 [Candidatus Magasanikbacteria bacterium]
MRHRVAGKKLGRTKNQRTALFRSLANNLILHEKIVTTEVKAKAVKPLVEKLITRAKINTIHNRRLLIKELVSENTTKKMLEVIGPKFKERLGGYTKIIKLGDRAGDKAAMVALMFVEDLGMVVKPIKVKEVLDTEKKKEKKVAKKVKVVKVEKKEKKVSEKAK